MFLITVIDSKLRIVLALLIIFCGIAESKCVGSVKFVGMDAFGGHVNVANLLTIKAQGEKALAWTYPGGNFSLDCGIYGITSMVTGFGPYSGQVKVEDGKNTFLVVELTLGLIGGPIESRDKKIVFSDLGGCSLLWVKAVPLASALVPISIEMENSKELQLGQLRPGKYYLHGIFMPGCRFGKSMDAVLNVGTKTANIIGQLSFVE